MNPRPGLLRPSTSLVTAVALFLAVASIIAQSLPTAPGEAAGDVWLFSYFTGNGEDGLHLARSDDGRRWTPVGRGRSFLARGVGARLTRDPSIARGPDGQFHLVWTTGWWDHGLGVAHSADLRNWSAQAFVPMLEGTPVAAFTPDWVEGPTVLRLVSAGASPTTSTRGGGTAPWTHATFARWSR